MGSKLGTKIGYGGGCFFAGFARETADLEVQHSQGSHSCDELEELGPKKKLKKEEGGRRREGRTGDDSSSHLLRASSVAGTVPGTLYIFAT